jgi:hypothetical protein
VRENLEDIIRRYVYFKDGGYGGGWHKVLHSACDHGKKGDRAGFKFDGDTVGFNCFNCGESAMYDPSVHKVVPRKMRKILVEFGVPHDEWKKVVDPLDFKEDQEKKAQKKDKKLDIKEIELPEQFYKLSEAGNDDVWAEIARIYLKERKIPEHIVDFRLCGVDNPYGRQWAAMLITPFYKDGKCIFYQGRDLTGERKSKYNSAHVERGAVLWDFDNIFKFDDIPLFIVEGVYDALSLYPYATAILTNKMEEGQIEWLKRSRRKKIYIPDLEGDGATGARQAIKQGWDVAFIQGSGCKDVNDVLVKYGKIYLVDTLIKNTFSGIDAEVQLNIRCR